MTNEKAAEIAISVIKEAIDMTQSLKEDNWISVEDRLPENDNEVAICIKWSDGSLIVRTGHYFEHGSGLDECIGINPKQEPEPPYWVRDNHKYWSVIEDVAYWQPLPKPPKP